MENRSQFGSAYGTMLHIPLLTLGIGLKTMELGPFLFTLIGIRWSLLIFSGMRNALSFLILEN